MLTDCATDSVCVEPYPSSQALYVPPCAASPCELHWPIAPVVPVQLPLPDSKPPLTIFWPEQPVVVPTVQLNDAVPVLVAASFAVTVTLEVPAVVPVPEIVPVEALMDRPAGRPVAVQEY